MLHGRRKGVDGLLVVHACCWSCVIPPQVSGEYAMLYHGSKAKAFDLRTVVMETVESMRRAGTAHSETGHAMQPSLPCMSFLVTGFYSMQGLTLSYLTTHLGYFDGSKVNLKVGLCCELTAGIGNCFHYLYLLVILGGIFTNRNGKLSSSLNAWNLVVQLTIHVLCLRSVEAC